VQSLWATSEYEVKEKSDTDIADSPHLFVSAGNIAASYILLADEAPQHYPTTFRIVIGVMGGTIALALLLALIMYMDNKRRSRMGNVGEFQRTDNEADAKDEVIDTTDGSNLNFRYML
jgi:hypothetical protein